MSEGSLSDWNLILGAPHTHLSLQVRKCSLLQVSILTSDQTLSQSRVKALICESFFWYQMCGLCWTPTNSPTPTKCPAIKFWHHSESTRTPQAHRSVPQHCAHCICQLQASGAHLSFWVIACKSEVPITPSSSLIMWKKTMLGTRQKQVTDVYQFIIKDVTQEQLNGRAVEDKGM